MIEWLPPVPFGLLGIAAATVLVLALLARWIGGPTLPPARGRGLRALRAAILLMLLAILANPVRIEQSPDADQGPEVVGLLDSSQSMALDKGPTRFDDALRMIGEIDRRLGPGRRPHWHWYRFGQRLAAIEPGQLIRDPLGNEAPAAAAAAQAAPAAELAPTDADTQLLAALRQLAGTFGRSPPQAIVVFSDGQARDPAGVEEMARRYARMGVPIHTVPLGRRDPQGGGDVAIISMVVPSRVRKFSQVSARAWIRSYGYDGVRTELRLAAIDPQGRTQRELSRLPIILSSGIQSFNLTFQVEQEPLHLEISLPPQPHEVSTANNAFTADVAVDRTKLRVLYLEGTEQELVVSGPANTLGGTEIVGAHSPLSRALGEDPDIESTILMRLPGRSRFASLSQSWIGFAESAATLFAYDVLVLSNIDRDAIEDRELEWIEEWIGERGGGLCMTGGPRSFAAGGWRGSPLEKLLPVTLGAADQDWVTDQPLSMIVVDGTTAHPLWHIVADDSQNRAILTALPAFSGANRVPAAKTSAAVLATLSVGGGTGQPLPAIAVAPYGRGRTMAMAVPLTGPSAVEFAGSWGLGDNRYYSKFWRNAVYWLSENSATGRRRLLATTNKVSYQPGETIRLQALAYDEAAHRVTSYRIAATVDPQAPAGQPESDGAPIRWPRDLPRASGQQGPCLAWGEEFELPRRTAEQDYAVELPIAEVPSSVSAAQTLRIDLSAYDDSALVDGTSLDVQIIEDPFERQNPLPNHELLGRVAMFSGGEVLRDATALAARLRELPSRVDGSAAKRSPVWDRWWLLSLLLVLLTVEWTWRRRQGLA